MEQTKSAQIMALYAEGLSTREIADRVGCRPEYVRVVARQRKGSGYSEIDRRYVMSSLGMSTRRGERQRRYKRGMAAADFDEIRRESTAAYRAARDEGKSPREATRAYNYKRMQMIFQAAVSKRPDNHA